MSLSWKLNNLPKKDYISELGLSINKIDVLDLSKFDREGSSIN
jgi:hypothetical protein